MLKLKIAAPQGNVKGCTFNKITRGFKVPKPGGYQREAKSAFLPGHRASISQRVDIFALKQWVEAATC